MEDSNENEIRKIGPVNFIIILLGCCVVAFFAVSSLFFLSSGHKPSYYINNEGTVSEFTIVDNVMNFKLKGYQTKFIIEFNENPDIKQTDTIEIESNNHQGFVQVYVNSKLVYDKLSDLTFTEITDDGVNTVSHVIKNIKDNKLTPTTSIL